MSIEIFLIYRGLREPQPPALRASVTWLREPQPPDFESLSRRTSRALATWL